VPSSEILQNLPMMPILFHLGSLPIFSFGVLMSLAFVVAGWVMQRDFARKREPRELAWEIVGKSNSLFVRSAC